MNEILYEKVQQDVVNYLLIDNSQMSIQEARSELRQYRLGRQPETDWQWQQVRTIRLADKLLQVALSDTLERNRKSKSRR